MACNQYVWHVFYQREGKNPAEHLDTALGEVAKAGLDGFEPIAGTAGDVAQLAPLLEKHGLEMRSLYVNSTLHDPDLVTRSMDEIMAIAEAARGVGARMIVTNPSPIQWGAERAKNDEQLLCQAAALNRLGKSLRGLNLQLAYHYHDIELHHAAREFHHMMVGTDPEWVGLCLDAHWFYRGAGHSAVALFDVVQLVVNRSPGLMLDGAPPVEGEKDGHEKCRCNRFGFQGRGGVEPSPTGGTNVWWSRVV